MYLFAADLMEFLMFFCLIYTFYKLFMHSQLKQIQIFHSCDIIQNIFSLASSGFCLKNNNRTSWINFFLVSNQLKQKTANMYVISTVAYCVLVTQIRTPMAFNAMIQCVS